jgi:hypothetical protein
MKNTVLRVVFGLIALVLAIAFFSIPVIKLKDPALIIVILIGVVAMVYNFYEVITGKDD